MPFDGPFSQVQATTKAEAYNVLLAEVGRQINSDDGVKTLMKLPRSAAAFFAKCLKFNNVLKKCKLSSSKILDAGAAALGESLKTNTSLEELRL